ncbi:unknown [Prevotella sp. CAG:1185]|nr:unknown [Prevotella sp. CAG:1185]
MNEQQFKQRAGSLSSYENEPENYVKARKDLEQLMIKANKINSEFEKLAELPIIAEQFDVRIIKASRNLNKLISLLGEMYGFCLIDDVLQNRLKTE